MCTISWLATGEGLTICFNRDESIARARAEAPRLHRGSAHAFLAPRDPLGGGTWLAVRADGVALALLNHYGGWQQAAPGLSRGAVVWQLASAADPATAWREFAPSLDRTLPFHLLTLRRDAVRIDTWNGITLRSRHAGWPVGMLTTSSSPDPLVLPRRQRAFERLASKSAALTGRDLMRFHQGSDDADAHGSVWMDRGDRRTVSQSRIELGATTARFSYRECFGRERPPAAWSQCGISIPPP